MPRAFTQADPKLWTPDRTLRVSTNIRNRLGATLQNESHLAALGRQFYPHWNEDSHYLADRASISPEHAAAGMARLSPKTDAEMNRLMAYQAVNLDDTATSHIRRSAELSAEAGRQKRAGNEVEHAKLTAASKQARKMAGLPGTPLNLQSSSAISLSLHHFRGESEHPFNELGNVKIHDFARAIHDPGWHSQVVDTHYHDAGIGRTDVPYEADRKLGNVGVYRAYQEAAAHAYRMAGKRGLIDTRETTPNAFMGQVWYGHIQAKLDTNPDANKARRAGVTRMGNFLSRDNAHLWDPARHGMRSVENSFRT